MIEDASILKMLLDSVCEVAKAAGRMMREEALSEILSKEGHANFVTNMDVKVQQFVISGLKPLLPEAMFLAEEGEADRIPQGYCWVIDPIDGTTNYITDYHHSCVSIGLVYENAGVLGVVYDPYLDEVFSAMQGGGAFVNGQKIQAADREAARAVISLGTCPYRTDLREVSFAAASHCMKDFADIRRSGSAALDLAYVASGRTDGYFEYVLQPWDYAAGSLIVQEAGGICDTLDEGGWTYDHAISIYAASRRIEPALKAILQEELK